MAAERALGLQLQVRQNAAELQDYLRDLDRWESDIKQKDEELRKAKVVHKKILPPVRNAKKKKKKKGSSQCGNPRQAKDNARLGSYDYRGWDRFDVDKVLKDIDDEEEMTTVSSDESEETDEEIELERKTHRAMVEKDKGNDLFKKGQFEEAINCYSTGMQLDPSNALLPANRAMALLKIEKYGAAEVDCTLAISLDDTYTKAYLRRAATRYQLGRLAESRADYEHVLRLEPGNKQAVLELQKVKEKLGIKDESATTEIRKPSEEQNKTVAKKPMKRIVIEEIGTDSSDDESSTNQSADAPHTSGRATAAAPTSQTRGDCAPATPAQHPTAQTVAEAKAAQATSAQTQQRPAPNRTFSVPRTSTQFLSDWKALQRAPEQRCRYLQAIKPDVYPKLFQQSIDSEVLLGILTIQRDYYIPEGRPVFDEMRSLAQVKRFGMAVMFLSGSEKKVLEDLFAYLRRDRESSGGGSDSEISALAKKYGLS